MGLFLRLLMWLLGIFLTFQVVLRLVRKAHPFPMPFASAAILENPLRLRLAPPAQLVDRLRLAPGMHVLEVGPGSGVFTVEVAHRLGPTGYLAAVDVQPQMLAKTEDKIRAAGLANVETLLADAAELPFADQSFDLAFFVTVLGEIPDKAAALAEAHRVLRPGGRLSVTELLMDPDYSLRSTVIARCREAGFALSEEYGNFFAYTVNFQKLAA